MHPTTAPTPADRSRQQWGVEHELRLWRGRGQVDFRLLIAAVAGNIRTLDPGDPRARRLPSGTVLTADGWEAELASPPLPVSAGSAPRLDALLREERTELRDRASAHGVDRITGFSTHLNVSVPDDRAVGIGRRFVATCLRSMAVVTEPTGSQGMFVRPRRGRLELGCEYVEGPRLIAALTLYASCLAGLRRDTAPRVDRAPRLEPSREKFGWFVPPTEFSDASELALVWEWARPWAVELGLCPGSVDGLLDSGGRPVTPSDCTFGRAASPAPPTHTRPRTLPSGITAETEWLTWSHVVWLFRAPSGSVCRWVVRTDREAAFLDNLDRGELDLPLARMLRRSVVRRRLLVNAQLGDGGLFHDVRPGALVPAEREMDGSVPRVSRREARRDLHRATVGFSGARVS